MEGCFEFEVENDEKKEVECNSEFDNIMKDFSFVSGDECKEFSYFANSTVLKMVSAAL